MLVPNTNTTYLLTYSGRLPRIWGSICPVFLCLRQARTACRVVSPSSALSPLSETRAGQMAILAAHSAWRNAASQPRGIASRRRRRTVHAGPEWLLLWLSASSAFHISPAPPSHPPDGKAAARKLDRVRARARVMIIFIFSDCKVFKVF